MPPSTDPLALDVERAAEAEGKAFFGGGWAAGLSSVLLLLLLLTTATHWLSAGSPATVERVVQQPVAQEAAVLPSQAADANAPDPGDTP